MAVSAARLAPHEGQSPRPLHEKATTEKVGTVGVGLRGMLVWILKNLSKTAQVINAALFGRLSPVATPTKPIVSCAIRTQFGGHDDEKKGGV